MELNIRIPDHTSVLFDYLQKGQFICSNSCDETVRDMYEMIDDNFEALSLYFLQIGYTLERGNEYFYFSRTEPRATLEQKILRAYYWIDVLDLFSYLMRYTFKRDVGEQERTTIFCQIVSLYESQFRISDTYGTYKEFEYAKVYPA